MANTLRRGFKAEAERLAARLRAELSVQPDARANVDELARHIGIEVRDAEDLVGRSRLEELDRLQPGSFSAATIHLPSGRIVAVVNTVNSTKARRDSDLAHEIAHILLKHEPRRVDRVGDLAFFDCDPEQELEANWLAGCILLPRPLLLIEARRGMSADDIADKHSVSLEMARFRLNTSGVYFQVRRSGQARGTRH